MPDRPRSLPGAPALDVALDFEGLRVPAASGEPVGVALLRAGHWVLSRSGKYHRPRGLFCLAEGCGSCLMRIGGKPDRFACTAPSSEGLSVETQNSLPSAGTDLLRAIDWAFPAGMDHHELLVGVPVAHAVMQRVARQLAGLGELPDRPLEVAPAPAERRVALCIVGLGIAGRAAAKAAAQAGIEALALDLDDSLAPVPGIPCWLGAQALAVYRDGGAPLVAVRRGETLLRVRPERLLLATGSRDQGASFEENDRPGILGGRAVLRLIGRHHLLPSGAALVLGDGPEALPVCRALAQAGARVTWVTAHPGAAPGAPPVERLVDHVPLRAVGGSRLRGLDLAAPNGTAVRWRGGLVATCGPRAPAFELGVQCGVPVDRLARGFALRVDGDGRTAVAWLFAAGSCTGAPGPSEPQGTRAGLAAAGAVKRPPA